ncbi:MAG TPA: cell wall-binding repeat-containing protein, partial [Euzebya sp.]|nr:cell wall-binding repeat-containing protein [Euzebya sp.]
TLEITRQDDALVGEVTGGSDVCEGQAQANGGLLLALVPRTCLDEAPEIRIAATMMYQPTEGGATAVDFTPDNSLTAPLPDDPPASPVCANATVEGDEQLTIRRLACGIGGTEPISQAVATSQFVFDNPNTPAIDPYTAEWVVLARDDDFADALAGSSLSFGQGPLLFTYSPTSSPTGRDPGRLADITRAEILRSLPRGRTVYLLGGSAALHPGLDAELEDLGYEVVRFAGTGRENTARLIAHEVRRIVIQFNEENGFPDVRMAFVVNRSNWPDAVLAGSVGAYWGMPILLTDVNDVHAETRAAIEELDIDYIHIAGGTAVISTPVLQELRTLVDGRQEPGVDLNDPNSPWYRFCVNPEGGPEYGCRWPGQDRIGTAASVGQLNRDMLRRLGASHPFIPADQQQFAAAINMRRENAFAFALAAATVSGRFGGAVFLPAEGDNGDTLRDDVKFFTCPYIQDIREVVFIGDTDVLAPGFADQIRAHHADPTTSGFDPPCAS